MSGEIDFSLANASQMVMKRAWPYLVLLVLTPAVFWWSFPAQFHFDDYPLLLENPHVTEEFRYGNFLDHYGGRPLTLLSFHVNYRWFGEDATPYRLVNILLHCAGVLLLFRLLRDLQVTTGTALFASVLFALHPLQTQAVNYVWARSVLLMACFGLFSLLLARRHFPVSLVSFQLAVWSRTEALVLVLPWMLRNPSRRKPMLVLAGANALLFAFSVYRYAPQEIAWNHSAPLSYWMAQPSAVWKYFQLFVQPSGIHLDHDFLVPGVGAWLAALMALVLLVLAAFRFRKRAPEASLGFLWFLLLLVPSAVVANSDLFNESRSYLALAGLCLAAAWAVSRLPTSILPTATAGLVLFLLVPATLERNRLWRDEVALLEDAVQKSPEKGRVRYNLGVALARSGQLERACEEFLRAAELESRDDAAVAALGYCHEVEGNLAKAYRQYLRALSINPENEYARSRVDTIGTRVVRVSEDQPAREVLMPGSSESRERWKVP